MAYTLTAYQAPFGAVSAFRLVNFFTKTAESIREWRSERRTMVALDRLSEHQLKDIGLQRLELY